MSAIDTLRVALFGNPASPTHKPDREGTLAAFTELYEIVLGADLGVVPYLTVADLPVVTVSNNGNRARVYDDAVSTNNTYWIVVDGIWQIDQDFIDSVIAGILTDIEISPTITAVGDTALSSLTSGTLNTAVGSGALEDATSGSSNTGVGHAAGQFVTTGSQNSMFGFVAGRKVSTGENNVAVGYNALGENSVGTGNTAVGWGAAASYLGGEITAVGSAALFLATGAGNTALGISAGAATITGARNTFLGYSSGPNDNTSGSDIIAIGYGAQGTRDQEIALGTGSQTFLQLFGISWAHWDADAFNMWIGDDGPATDPTGQRNLGIGRVAVNSATTGSNNLGIGESALELQATGSNNVAIGVTALQLAVSVADTTVVGHGAAKHATTGVGCSILGYRAMEHSFDLSNNTAIGDSALYHTQGSANVGIGYVVAEGMSQGDSNIAIGRAAMRYRDDGDYNVFIGESAGAISTNSGSGIGIGDADPEDDIGGAAAGHRNVGIGAEALIDFLGSDAVAIGYRSGKSLVGTAATSLKNVFLGANAGNHGSQKVDASNSVALGADSYTDKNNQVVLGPDTITETVVRGVTRHTIFTVAALPSAATMGVGARAFVTDANVTMAAGIGTTVAGGGSNKLPVYSDGAAWKIG